ncbi:MAG TPA: SUMF1/EgtB/PvdO family nonheme iron enzyme [Tepidisphaeraceae bacterium]|nr:SUMF1/EgtB/PvdO family nonheme iron enzyme [Tepidisphaeraceae bacterium]
MAKIGNYEILDELHLTPHGSVSRARRADGERGLFAIKRLTLPVEEPGEPRWELQMFLDRARAQQQVVAGGATCWAAVHDLGMDSDSAYFVTDYHPLCVQRLIDSRVPVKAAALHAVIKAAVQGLAEMKAIRGRAHGNLKGSNVLIAGRDLPGARVLLADPASNAQAAKSGESGDAYALGALICGLVLYRDPANARWPLQSSSEWSRLGRRGDTWRRLCNELLSPVPGDRPNLAEIERRVQALRPRRKLPVRKIMTAVLVPLIVIGSALAVLSLLDHSARKRFCQTKRDWFARYAQAAEDSARRARWESDLDLRQLLAEAPVGQVSRIKCDDGKFLRYSIGDYRTVRAANAAAAQVQREMSGRWRVVIRTQELRDKFAERGWSQPDWYLGQLIDATRPAPGADVAGGIDRLLLAAPHVEAGLAMADSHWKQFSDRLSQIQAARDPVLTALATMLRKSAASDVRLTAGGFTGLDKLNADIEQADRLAEALRTTWPTNVDREHFDPEVAARINLKKVEPRDVDTWLALVYANAYRRTEAANAARDLRQHLVDTTNLVIRANLASDEAPPFDAARQQAALAVANFEQLPFTQQSIDSGAFSRKRDEVRNQIDALRKYYHPETPEDWLKTLPAVATGSQHINQRWQAWRKALDECLPAMARNSDVFLANQQATEQLRAVLVSLDQGFSPAPSLPVETYTAVARLRREQAIETLLMPLDPRAPKLDADAVKHAQDAYGKWSAELVGLSRDFPIGQELLTLDDRPDQKWKTKDPGFWNDPLVQALVKDDLARLSRLAALSSASREQLVKSAGSDVTEVALAAWRLLGAHGIDPPWPSQSNELTAELKIRQQLSQAIKYLKNPADAQAPNADLAEQGPIRWKRFARAATSEAMLQNAWNRQGSFGIDASAIAKLPAALRFDLFLALLRQAMSGGEDAGIRQALGGLQSAAADIKDRPEMGMLAARLARVEAKEPFADEKPGDVFKLALPGVKEAVQFRRVEPRAGHPFYLCTTEVSMGQFVAVIENTHTWVQAKLLPWNCQPGKTDDRGGPRVWQWSDQPGALMESPRYWYAPDEENDYPPAFRAGRFNRNSLSEAQGGNPSPDHPMQYISAQGALFYAGLCGCRLPTPAEWSVAYALYEKSVPPERWNLRDRTWEEQRAYVASTGASRWPDEGIFSVNASADSIGRNATSRPGNDGTLFFRPVGATDANVFQHLVGNVGEFVCDASEFFDAASDKKTADGVQRFVDEAPHSFFVIGGSALSAPEVPVDKPLPVTRTDAGYADVGLRLAFTAPSRSLAEKVKWLLGEQGYLFGEK